MAKSLLTRLSLAWFWLWLGGFLLTAGSPAGAAPLNSHETVTATPALNPSLQSLLANVSSDRIIQNIEGLSRYSRCLLDPGHDQAAAYITGQLKALGFSPVV